MSIGRMAVLVGLGLCQLLLSGCSATPSPELGTAGSSSELTERRVMVTFPSTSPFVVRRSIRELSVAYELSFVASWTMESLEQECVVFEVPENVALRPDSMERLLGSLSRDHRIGLAQRVQRFSTHSQAGHSQAGHSQAGSSDGFQEGDDSRSSYRRFQHAADLLRLDAAHRLATGKGVRVAVIDTGMDLGHPEYGRRVVEARDFVGRDEESFTTDLHGTAVAGLLAAAHDDGAGIVGVAPGVELMAVKACWPEAVGSRRAVCDSYTLALALDYAVTAGARVINLSLGGPDDPILRRLVEAGLERRIVLVAANGGEGADFPAMVPGVLDVRPSPREADTDRTEGTEGTKGADASGAAADAGSPAEGGWLAAPGREILTTVPGGYDFWNGVSMSAAQVSGVAALVLEHRPELTSEDLGTMLRETSRDNPGQALVDACAAVASASGLDC